MQFLLHIWYYITFKTSYLSSQYYPKTASRRNNLTFFALNGKINLEPRQQKMPQAPSVYQTDEAQEVDS